MSKITVITHRALEQMLDLMSHTRQSMRNTGQALQNTRFGSTQLLNKSGAALGAVRSGSKALTQAARRNPAVAVAATALVLGAVGYAMYRKRRKFQASLLEGVIEHPIDELPPPLDQPRRIRNAYFPATPALLHERDSK